MRKYRKFILICDSFPPATMGHAQRVAKLCKYLPRVSDWLPTVFCGVHLPETGNDLELAAEIPEEIEVFRVPAFESSGIYNSLRGTVFGKLLFHARKLYSFPDHRIDWARKLVKTAIKKFQNGKDFEVILASGPPRSAYVAGYWLAKHWKKPLIIDMRDPWDPKYLSRKYTPLHSLINKLWEKRIYKFSSIIIANTDGNREMLLRKNPELNKKVIVIPNGFDPDDMDPARGPSLRKENNNEQLNLLYLGGLRGKVAGKRIFEEPLLNLIKEIKDKIPELRDKLKLHFVGSDGSPIFDLVRKLQLQNDCIFHGAVSCKDVGRPLAEADICVLIINPEAEGSGWIPAKTYYYLASGKPILAISPECDATIIIRKHCLNYEIISPEDKNAIEKFKRMIYRIQEKNKSVNVNTSSIPIFFNRKEIALNISKLLNAVSN